MAIKTFHWYLIITCMLFIGCFKRYKSTVKVCSAQLFVETFNVNPAGVDADYLTDSISFRLYVGKFDNEHENFSYGCSGDSVFVVKFIGEDKIMESKVYSLKELKTGRKYEPFDW